MKSDYGELLGEAIYYAYTDWIDTKLTWQEFLYLFAQIENRVDLFNYVAPFAGHLIQKSLWQSVVFGICRLTDPPESMNNENASIQRLSQFSCDPRIPELNIKIQEAVNTAKSIRTYRNKLLAHNDLSTRRQAMSSPIPGASYDEVTASLDAVHSIFDYLSRQLNNGFIINNINVPDGGARHLLIGLLAGADRKKKRLETDDWQEYPYGGSLSRIDDFQP